MTVYEAHDSLHNLATAIGFSKDADDMRKAVDRLTGYGLEGFTLLHNFDVKLVVETDDLSKIILNGLFQCLHDSKLESEFIRYFEHELGNTAHFKSEKESE